MGTDTGTDTDTDMVMCWSNSGDVHDNGTQQGFAGRPAVVEKNHLEEERVLAKVGAVDSVDSCQKMDLVVTGMEDAVLDVEAGSVGAGSFGEDVGCTEGAERTVKEEEEGQEEEGEEEQEEEEHNFSDLGENVVVIADNLVLLVSEDSNAALLREGATSFDHKVRWSLWLRMGAKNDEKENGPN
jgi:hypothetical protein